MSTLTDAIEHVLTQRELAELRAENRALREHLATATEVARHLTGELTAHLVELTAAYARIDRLEGAIERAAVCLATPNPGITDVVWLDPRPGVLCSTLYEFLCQKLGREVHLG